MTGVQTCALPICSKSLKFIKKLPDISGSVIIIKSIHYLSGETDRFTKAQGFDLHNMFKSDKNDPTKVDSIAGIKSGYLFDFLENASASKHLVGSYLKSYLS